MRTTKIAIAVTPFAAIAALAFLYSHDPSAHTFYPRCIFHVLTGLQCPGCGATRALYQMLHGNILAALRFNALFVLASPALAVATTNEAIARWNGRATNLTRSPWISWAIAVVIIGWGVMRNF